VKMPDRTIPLFIQQGPNGLLEFGFFQVVVSQVARSVDEKRSFKI